MEASAPLKTLLRRAELIRQNSAFLGRGRPARCQGGRGQYRFCLQRFRPYNRQMIAENSDIVALTAQADIHRLYVEVLQPALRDFASADDVVGECERLDEFLDAARTNTHNLLCHELRRSFVLILSAVFERHLRSWLSRKMPVDSRDIESETWPKLVRRLPAIDPCFAAQPVTAGLESLHLVANAVRHGNGRSAEILFQKMPQFWSATKMRPEFGTDLVGNMRIDDASVASFVIAILKFWHLAGASSLPGQPG